MTPKETPVAAHSALIRWFWELPGQGIVVTDRDLRIIVWNRWMEVHSGRSAAETVGRALVDIYPDLIDRGMDQHYSDALAGRVIVMSYGLNKYVLRLPPARADIGLDAMPQSGRIGPLVDEHGVVGTVTTIQDVSDRLATESELRKQIEVQRIARVAAEKAMRARDSFLATVSHEIRSPLNAVLGWARILTERTDVAPDVLARALRVIERNASAQARMIDDLLDVARIASGKLRLEMQPVDLVAVALTTIDVVALSAKTKQIELRTRLDPGTPRVLGDQQRLQQIIWNLLSNAVKFTDPGGTIEVSITRSGPHARVVVSDTGRGISAEFLPFVFERFRQSDTSSAKRFGGLGLGLALVRELVELHGGTVAAESAGEGSGATFRIDIPSMSPELRADRLVSSSATLAAAPSLEGVRVLVVDDDCDSRDLLGEVLSRCGAQVSLSGSAEDALSRIRASTPLNRPHVIVSDLGMPGVDGFQLMHDLRALDGHAGGRIPAVAVSAYAMPDDRERALAAGYLSHVAKPIDPVAVVTAVAWAQAQRDAL